MAASLFPARVTRCAPEHLEQLKHEIHYCYGEIESIKDEGNWKVVTWHEGQEPAFVKRTNECFAAWDQEWEDLD